MLEERLYILIRKIKNNYYRQFSLESVPKLSEEMKDLSWDKQVVELFKSVVKQEKCIIEDDEKIIFWRTTKHPINPVPSIYIKEEKISGKKLIGNRVHNICADWEGIIGDGILKRIQKIDRILNNKNIELKQIEYLSCMRESLEVVLELVNKYVEEAIRKKRYDIVEILKIVPQYPAQSFRQALQSLRILHGVLWMNGHNHVGLGRFDQYMWPYLKHDLDKKILSIEEARELLAEFFISLNKDSSILPGIQNGDNGQSLMLGGTTKTGEDAVNELTYLVLDVAEELGLPDPKINLRLNRKSDERLLESATRLTQKGIGMPQYINEEIAISSLVHNKYDIEDARDFVVAACWELIIPGKGMDVPNINALSFPYEVDTAIRRGLRCKLSFPEILQQVKNNIESCIAKYVEEKKNIKYWPPAPLFSSFMSDCIEAKDDINRTGAKYCNYRIHGSGISHAADALVAVYQLVYVEKSCSTERMLQALEKGWDTDRKLQKKIKTECPKVGNNDERVDCFLRLLGLFFAEACQNMDGKLRKMGKAIHIQAGTGTAMYYLWLTGNGNRPSDRIEPLVGTTADGREQGEPLAANLSPALGVKTLGPISCMMSFSKLDYQKMCNGGPITIEILPETFGGDLGRKQIINLLKVFIHLNCQQLQLNMVSKDDLIAAQKNPERYRNLIVRVWGWSAYFCELDKEFQDQIIMRQFF